MALCAGEKGLPRKRMMIMKILMPMDRLARRFGVPYQSWESTKSLTKRHKQSIEITINDRARETERKGEWWWI